MRARIVIFCRRCDQIQRERAFASDRCRFCEKLTVKSSKLSASFVFLAQVPLLNCAAETVGRICTMMR